VLHRTPQSTLVPHQHVEELHTRANRSP
jgi:hypothetical protein